MSLVSTADLVNLGKEIEGYRKEKAKTILNLQNNIKDPIVC